MKKAGFACLGLLILFVAMSGAGDRPPSSAPRSAVQVMDCKITLIDHVTQASDRSGILSLVNITEGDSVVTGSQIALIDDRVAKANLAVAELKASNENEIEYAQVAHLTALNKLEVMERANRNSKDSHAVSKTDVEEARLAAKKAEVSIKVATHELNMNKLNRDVTKAELDTYSVNAEFDGVVVKVFKKKGEAVRQGDPVAEIVNTDRVRIKGRVKLSDLPFAKQGAKVKVRLFIEDYDLPGANEVFEGIITFVDLVSNEMDQTVTVHAEVKNRDNILRAGLDALMEIPVDDDKSTNRERQTKDRVVGKPITTTTPDQ
jgi:multidrug resistance efflux pump